MAVNFASSQAAAGEVVDDIVSAGGCAVAIGADIGSEPDIVRLFETAERELGPIQGLVNNAGVTGGFARVETVTAQALGKTFAVNVVGAILCAREAVRRMSTRNGGTGRIHRNVSSLAAEPAPPENGSTMRHRKAPLTASPSDSPAKWPPRDTR